MAEPTILQRTEEQVRELVRQLAVEASLPGVPEEGSFWWQMSKAIREAYVMRAEREAVREGRAIIMAGPPGAGKSRGVAAVREALGPKEAKRCGVVEEGYVTVDADDVKQLLLGNPVPGLEVDPRLVERARQHWDGLIAREAPERLADGQPLLRGELATLVHHLSTETATQARKRLEGRGFNIKIEGTLQWMEPSGMGQGPLLVSELRQREYVQVTVVAVDSPRELCLEGVRRRWTESRSHGDVTARYIPPEAVEGMFVSGTSISRCIDNARLTHRLASAESSRLSQVDLFIAHRRADGTVIEHVTRDGRQRAIPLGRRAPVSRSVPAQRSWIRGPGLRNRQNIRGRPRGPDLGR